MPEGSCLGICKADCGVILLCTLTGHALRRLHAFALCLQVRHDKRVGASSAVRFLTDGVLMRQLQSDFLLRTYSIILLDEAHERSLNTDLLLGECLPPSQRASGLVLHSLALHPHPPTHPLNLEPDLCGT